jgi:hypothetical protein
MQAMTVPHFAGSVAAVELLNHLISSHRGKTTSKFLSDCGMRLLTISASASNLFESRPEDPFALVLLVPYPRRRSR